MKYLFQQMLAFWSIIIVILVVVGVSFVQFTKQTILESNYQQMLGYAENILYNNLQKSGNLLNNVQLTEHVLQNQQVTFIYINANQLMEYPIEAHGSETTGFITPAEWETVQGGQTVEKTLEINLKGAESKVPYAMVLVPIFDSKSNFYGSLSVLQPIKNIETSMRSLTDNLFKGFLLSSIIALFFSYMIAQFQVNRISRMKRATRQIAEGNFDVNLDIKANDELDELALDFNKMAVALKDTNEELVRQEERRRQFMADAAHEMRTPLTTINGLLEGLAFKAIPADQEEKCIELMRNETTRLIRLVNENLDYEKIRTNQISMVVQRFSATKTLQQVVEQLSGKAEASGNRLTLTTSEDVPIYADYDRFVQIVVNIIQNAIQFTTDGTIDVAVEKGYLETVVTVTDTGIGMEPDEVDNIWERYYKVDPSRKNTKFGESGLGLSIVHQLVKLHHGEIKVESEKDVGTTFTIVFPDKDVKPAGTSEEIAS